jgi:outer membrane biogenesis lipoprotein LolB
VSPARALLTAALALGLAACATPTGRPLAPDDPHPAALLERWSASVADRRALRGTARLSVDARRPDGEPLRLRSKQRLVLARPDRLRVEVQGFLGTTLAVLTVDAQRYALLQTEERHYESGRAYPGLLRDVVGLDLATGEAIDLILGDPGRGRPRRVGAAFALADGITRVELADADADGGRHSLDLDREARLRRFSLRDARGAVRWQARYADYAAVSGSPVAHRVELELPSASAVLALSGVELNPALDPDIFRLDPIATAAEGG